MPRGHAQHVRWQGPTAGVRGQRRRARQAQGRASAPGRRARLERHRGLWRGPQAPAAAVRLGLRLPVQGPWRAVRLGHLGPGGLHQAVPPLAQGPRRRHAAEWRPRRGGAARDGPPPRAVRRRPRAREALGRRLRGVAGPGGELCLGADQHRHDRLRRGRHPGRAGASQGARRARRARGGAAGRTHAALHALDGGRGRHRDGHQGRRRDLGCQEALMPGSW
mmetsp:Transcript_76380/g.196705  ORF Transcript_76380/g.196705 Transcript_76380/m.196705 type:complete len:221 (+) Transcript_76380:564-1226(+)